MAGTANRTLARAAAIADHSASGVKPLQHDRLRAGQQAGVHPAETVLM